MIRRSSKAIAMLALSALSAMLVLAYVAVVRLHASDPLFADPPPRLLWDLATNRLRTDLIDPARGPWQLAAAFDLLLAGLGLTALAILARRLAPAIEERAASWQSSHVVLVASGETATGLAQSLRGTDETVVWITGDVPARGTEPDGTLIVHGDAARMETLRRAGLARATALVVADADDARNLAIAAAARRLVEEAPNRGVALAPLRCVVQIHDPELRTTMTQSRSTTVGGRVGTTFFSPEREAALRFFRDRPVHGYADVDAAAPCLALVGWSPIAAEVVLRAVQDAQYGGSGPTIIVFAESAEAIERSFRERYSGIDLVAAVRFVPIAPDAPRSAFDRAAAAGWLEKLAVVFACSSDAGRNVLACRALAGVLARDEALLPQVVIWRNDHDAWVAHLEPSALGANVARVVTFAAASVGERLLGHLDGSLDRLARAAHQAYVDGERQDAVPERASAPYAETWESLPEDVRDANRGQVNDYPVKEHILRLVRDASAQPSLPPFDPGELDRAARGEHARWAAERIVNGWTHGAAKNVTAKKHPALVPFERLDAATQAKDVDAVIRVPAVLQAAGITVRSRRAAAIVPSSALAEHAPDGSSTTNVAAAQSPERADAFLNAILVQLRSTEVVDGLTLVLPWIDPLRGAWLRHLERNRNAPPYWILLIDAIGDEPEAPHVIARAERAFMLDELRVRPRAARGTVDFLSALGRGIGRVADSLWCTGDRPEAVETLRQAWEIGQRAMRRPPDVTAAEFHVVDGGPAQR
jgi:hypothetical protein